MSINVTVTAGLTAGLTTGPAAMGRVTNILRARRITAIRSDRGEGKIPMVPSRLLLLHVWSLVAATVPHHNTSNDDEYQRKQPPSTHTESNHQRLICSACTTIARRPGAVPARLYRPIDKAPIRSAEAAHARISRAILPGYDAYVAPPATGFEPGRGPSPADGRATPNTKRTRQGERWLAELEREAAPATPLGKPKSRQVTFQETVGSGFGHTFGAEGSVTVGTIAEVRAELEAERLARVDIEAKLSSMQAEMEELRTALQLQAAAQPR